MLGPVVTRTLSALQAAHGALTGRTGGRSFIPRRWGGAGPWLWLGTATRTPDQDASWALTLQTSPDQGVAVNVAVEGHGQALVGWMPSHRKCVRQVHDDTQNGPRPTFRLGDVQHVGPHARLRTRYVGHGSRRG